MVWPLDLFPSNNVSLNRRMWNVCKLAIFLLLLLLVAIHSSGFFLRRANGFGRNCLQLAGEDENEMETKIAIVSFLDEGGRGEVVDQIELFGRKWAPPARMFEGLMEIVKSNKVEYARTWGYDFIDARSSVDRSRPTSWSKIPTVRSHLDRYDWIFLNDAERILQSVLGHSNPDQYPDLIVTEDVNGVNAGKRTVFCNSVTLTSPCCAPHLHVSKSDGVCEGMFFVRRSKWSEEFPDSWWNEPLHHPWLEEKRRQRGADPPHQVLISVGDRCSATFVWRRCSASSTRTFGFPLPNLSLDIASCPDINSRSITPKL